MTSSRRFEDSLRCLPCTQSSIGAAVAAETAACRRCPNVGALLPNLREDPDALALAAVGPLRASVLKT